MENTANQLMVIPNKPATESTRIKRTLSLYMLISSISFSYLVLAEQAGISILVFVAIQFLCLYCWTPRKKPLLMFIPISMLALNAFISANTMWRIPNFFVGLTLYSIMALWLTNQLTFNESLTGFVIKPLKNLIAPFRHFKTPVDWGIEGHRAHLPLLKRVAIGIGISIPCLIILSIVLASADIIFAIVLADFFDSLFSIFSISAVFRVWFGLGIGLYLFGMFYQTRSQTLQKIKVPVIAAVKGDLIIINIVLVSVLFIYTVFVAIQFRYLFASPGNLPFGLNFVTYARRGFFELMALAGINIMTILATIWMTNGQTSKGKRLTRGLCFYLCAVTSVLLASSFYRMWLYGSDDGLTRMRFLVFSFLIFKAIGLVATFFYIAKPRFNIVAVYCLIALIYYVFLNLVPMDTVVAKSQINRYFETGRGGIAYVLTLSPDAAPQVARLTSSENESTRNLALWYFQNRHFDYTSWRQWNLSIDKLQRYR